MRVLLLAFLSILVFGVYAESEWVEDFIDELAKHEEDLAGEATDLNASASREKEETTPKPKTEVGQPDDDDDDDDDEDEIINPLLSIPNIFKLLRSPAVKPWWMGDNVCVERSESEPTEEETGKSSGVAGLFVLTGTARYQTCQNGPNKYICTTIVHENGKTTKSTVVRKCCKGYRLGHNSCEEIETKPFEEIAKELKCDEFVKNAQDEGMKEELEGAKTIFLPLDSGSKKLDEIDETNNILTNEVVETGRKQTRRSVLENHIVPETVERADFSNDMILKTINNGTIRINGYPSGVVTANCVPINKTDKFTKEGVVHVVERLIETPEKTVAQILEEKYPKFKALLGDADMNQDGITVLAVSDDSLSKFEPENVNCLMKILKHHILPRTVCSAPVSSSGKVFVADSQGEYLSFEMDDSNLMAGKVRVLKKDILGKNGVVHEVETLITPPSAVAPIDLLKRTHHTRFLDLLEKSGLKNLFEKAENVTIFVPIEESLEKLENLEKDELVEALEYHIAQGKHYARDLSDSENGLPTKHGESIKISQSRNILASLFGPPTPNVQCSRLRRVDGEVCNGVAHEISSPIIPPKGSVDEILSSPRFSAFKSLLEKTGLIEKLKNRDFTVLAVDNSGMETVKDETKKLLEDDEETRERFAKSHFLPGRVCCSEMDSSSSQWPFSNPLRNLLGQILNWERTRSGSKISGIDIKECDIPAKDGLIHLIKEPLLTSEKLSGHNIKIRRPGSEIILAGF